MTNQIDPQRRTEFDKGGMSEFSNGSLVQYVGSAAPNAPPMLGNFKLKIKEETRQSFEADQAMQ